MLVQGPYIRYKIYKAVILYGLVVWLIGSYSELSRAVVYTLGCP